MESPRFHWDLNGVLALYCYLAIWVIAFKTVPNALDDVYSLNALLFIGFLGTWRYGWWMVNVLRGVYFNRRMFPRMRAEADAIWQSGWRPGHVHFLMTTFHEIERTTNLYLDALVRELKREGLTGTLWVGYGAPEDALAIRRWREKRYDTPPLDIVMVEQNQPGKRMAIGVILRALARHGVSRDDIAYLMDGDSILGEGVLRKTLPLFARDPELMALTTDEDAIVEGPSWVQKWLTMRFAQRRLWMSSHAVSERVLTLTGRASAYRATAVVDREFIRNVEADQLSHWLWGNFRFLSGDDKSTWYTLLRQGGKMTYVPDAMVYTIEYIEGTGLRRMRDNLLRWSGNMLRNGTRAILLGPKKVPPFIWWCLIDQRISIWTVLTGFSTAMILIFFVNSEFVYTYLLWVFFTRFLMSMTLFFYSDRIRMSYPFLLYVNQLLSAILKVYIMFRLPKQRWANRKGQKGGDDVMNNPGRLALASYVNGLYICTMFFIIFLVTGILDWPKVYQL